MESHALNNNIIPHVEGERLYGNKTMTSSENHHSFRYETRAVNFSSRRVFVVQRNGFVAELEPATSNTHMDCLVITHRASNSARIGMDMIGGGEDEFSSDMSNSLVKDKSLVYWEEKFELSEVAKAKNGVYCHRSDLMVFTNSRQAKAINHPYSQQKLRNDYLQAHKDFDCETMINVGLRLIDNEGSLPRQFLIFHDRILPITPVADPLQKSGFYVTGLTEMISVGSTSVREDVYYSLADAKSGKAPFTLYDSHAAARAAFHENVTREKEKEQEHERAIKELERETKLMQKEWEREKAELMKEKSLLEMAANERTYVRDERKAQWEYERDREKVDYEKDILKLKKELEDLKADTEKRSQHNKLLTEEMKTIGLIISFGFIVYKAFNNNDKGK